MKRRKKNIPCCGGNSLFKVTQSIWQKRNLQFHISMGKVRSLLLCTLIWTSAGFYTAHRRCVAENLKQHKMSHESSVFWWISSTEEIHIFLPRCLCWSRCVRICFPAVSRCYSETPMCLTSCGHKTLSKIVSSKALFLEPRHHKAIYDRHYKKQATFHPRT